MGEIRAEAICVIGTAVDDTDPIGEAYTPPKAGILQVSAVFSAAAKLKVSWTNGVATDTAHLNGGANLVADAAMSDVLRVHPDYTYTFSPDGANVTCSLEASLVTED